MQKDKGEFAEKDQPAPIHLTIRSSIAFSDSIAFSNIQTYSDKLDIPLDMAQELDIYKSSQDFESVRSSYRKSIAIIQHPQLLKQQPQNPRSKEQQQQNQQEQRDMTQSYIRNIPKLYKESQILINETPITVLLILLSKDEIQSVSTINDKKKEFLIKISKRKIFDKNAALALFTINKSEVNNFSLKYKVTKSSLFVFSKTEEKTASFSNLIIHEQAGLLCKQIVEVNSDQQVNSCILEAHQYLVKYLEQLQKLNINIFKQFYTIFKKHFRPYSNTISAVFHQISIDRSNGLFSQFFLYFVFIIYRQKALQVLRQHNLYQKLKFNRNSIPKILNRKRYCYYQNGQYLKQFVLYALFCYGYNMFSQNIYTFLKIAKGCIMELSPLYVKTIFSKLQKLQNREMMNSLLQAPIINDIFIANQEISFIQYFQTMLKYCETAIPFLRSQGNVQKMNDLLLNFLIKLASKSKKTPLSSEEIQALPTFEKRITYLFKNKSQYNLEIKRLGQIYMQIKGFYQLTPKLAELFLNVLKAHIFSNCQVLLKYFFTSIIYPLVILPQIAEQTSILIDYFMKKQLQTQNIIIVIKILLQDKKKVYNYQTIQFVLKKLVKQNPFINEFKVSELRKCFVDWPNKQAISSDRKKFLLCFIELLETKKQLMSDAETFQAEHQ